MGAFTQGFDQGSQAGAGDLARQRMLEDEQRRSMLNLAIGQYNNTTDPDQRTAIQNGIKNLYPTPAHGPQFLSDLLHLKARSQGQQPAQPSAPPSSPSQASPSATDSLGVPFTGLAPSTSSSTVATPPLATPSAPSGAVSPQVAQVAQAPTAQDAWKAIAQIPSAAETAINTSSRVAKNQQDLEKLRANSAAEVARIRTQGNAAMQKLDAAAQSLGEESFATASPENKIQAMKNLHAANVTQSWKAVTDGNNIYAVDAHDPTKRQFLGHKDDLTQHLEYKTLTNADGSQYEVPFVTWTKKGSTQPILQTQGEVGAPSTAQSQVQPISSVTPQVPSTASAAPTASSATSVQPTNPGARPPGTKPQGGAVKGKSQFAPSTQTPPMSEHLGLPPGAIPFGSKGSPLLKSDSAQLTKVSEDANGALEALTAAKNAAQSPSPTSDQELIYSWVRSNVQGAGRMTQAEFTQAAHTGSLEQKAQNWWSLATTGKMTPQIRQMMLADIQRGSDTKQQMAAKLRAQVQQDMSPQKPPSSNSTSGPPAGTPKTAADYLKSIGVQ